MKKYNVLIAFELDGVTHTIGEVVELSDEAATTLVQNGNVEEVTEAAEETSSEEAAPDPDESAVA